MERCKGCDMRVTYKDTHICTVTQLQSCADAAKLLNKRVMRVNWLMEWRGESRHNGANLAATHTHTHRYRFTFLTII